MGRHSITLHPIGRCTLPLRVTLQNAAPTLLGSLRVDRAQQGKPEGSQPQSMKRACTSSSDVCQRPSKCTKWITKTQDHFRDQPAHPSLPGSFSRVKLHCNKLPVARVHISYKPPSHYSVYSMSSPAMLGSGYGLADLQSWMWQLEVAAANTREPVLSVTAARTCTPAWLHIWARELSLERMRG